MSRIVLHCAPHPDDETIGAPATLMALRDAGWRVVNLACGLGGPDRRRQREAELREACLRARFELRLSGGLDPRAAVREAIAALRPEVVVSPGPHELHPAHVLVAGAVREALGALGDGAPRWWMWAVWGSLRQPTLATPFGPSRMEEVLAALEAHEGELVRNDYRRLVEGRATMSASLAPELLFGFGSPADSGVDYAELLTEAVPRGGRWLLGRPRWLDGRAALAPPGEIEALVG
ncbi:MAG TPA: PIG-L family deacetylase [Solirubrobacterales bacterium]|nr:PIG-L family deacetylase [Solirubrobacterales bacterium]